MDKQLKQKWIKALRSGEYVQGTGKLVRDAGSYDRFCCLGVLVDVLGGEWTDERFDNYELNGLSYDQESFIDGGYGIGKTDQKNLATMNDLGQSFIQIADWIEKNL
jgi:hypothetical protein